MKICPVCNQIADYNAHFNAWLCTNPECKWMELELFKIMLSCNYCGKQFPPGVKHECIYTSRLILAKKVMEMEKRLEELERESK